MKPVYLLLRFVLVLAPALAPVTPAFAQSGATPVPAPFRSDADDLLSIDKVTVLPFTDNVQGIYARPLENHFVSLVEGRHRWDFVSATGSGPVLSPDELEAAPDKVIDVVKDVGVDAVFAGRVTKAAGGVTIHLSLFLKRDGKLLSQAILKDYARFDLADLKTQLERLLAELTLRLPYAGRVLSRDGNRVTVNLGLNDGLQKNQTLSVIQILQTQRHPKFNFLIRTEKEIFGRIKILKVDENLSFGVVVMEKERGAVQKGAKIGGLDAVNYGGGGAAALSLAPSAEDALANRDDGKLAFGDNAKAWVPQRPPSMGQVGARLGVGRYIGNTQLTGVGGLSASDSFSPNVTLDGELWITPEWTFHARLRQGIVATDNPRAGSKPEKLNQSLSLVEAGFGYTIRFGAHAWSPALEPFLGYFGHRLYGDASEPLAFTTMRYQGLKLGVRGSTPLGEAGEYGLGGEFSIAPNPSVAESPVTSGGSPKNTVVQFGVYGFKKLGERLKLVAALDFDMFATNFSGPGGRGAESATSASQRFTTLSAGVTYMF